MHPALTVLRWVGAGLLLSAAFIWCIWFYHAVRYRVLEWSSPRAAAGVAAGHLVGAGVLVSFLALADLGGLERVAFSVGVLLAATLGAANLYAALILVRSRRVRAWSAADHLDAWRDDAKALEDLWTGVQFALVIVPAILLTVLLDVSFGSTWFAALEPSFSESQSAKMSIAWTFLGLIVASMALSSALAKRRATRRVRIAHDDAVAILGFSFDSIGPPRSEHEVRPRPWWMPIRPWLAVQLGPTIEPASLDAPASVDEPLADGADE